METTYRSLQTTTIESVYLLSKWSVLDAMGTNSVKINIEHQGIRTSVQLDKPMVELVFLRLGKPPKSRDYHIISDLLRDRLRLRKIGREETMTSVCREILLYVIADPDLLRERDKRKR